MYKKITQECIEISKKLLVVGTEHSAYNRIINLSDDLSSEIETLIKTDHSVEMGEKIEAVLESIQMISNALDQDDISLLYDLFLYDLRARVYELEMR